MKQKYLYLFLFFFVCFLGFSKNRDNLKLPATDICSTALNLTVGVSFNDYAQSVNLTGATNSGVATPSCGNYQGGDRWFALTIPSTGIVVVETNGTLNYDTGLAVYSGSCGTLSLLNCDDNSGTNNYSRIYLTGQTPGATIYIRAWENFWGSSNAQFEISAYDPTLPATHLNFDGTNDYVNLGNSLSSSLNGATALTVEAWINPSVLNGWNNIITDYDGAYHKILLRVRNNNNIQFWLNGTVLNSAFTVPLNAWTHIAAVYDGANMYVYANGSLVASQAAVVSLPATSNQFNIGSRVGGTEYFTGNIDEVRVWNVVRTPNQIMSSKNCELQGGESGLLRYYKFNQGFDAANNSSVTTLTDATSNANNGTLTNFALTGSTSNWLAGSPVTSGSIIPSVATVSTPVVYNQGATATALTATTGTNGTGLMWYTVATGGTGSTTAPTPSTATVGSTSYWVSSTNANGCESERIQIVVNVKVANDDCSNAISLTVGNTFNDYPKNIDLTSATNSGSPIPTCGNFQGGDIWYTVTVPASGNVVIETDGAGAFDTGLEVYTGNCGTLSLVACDDNSGNGNYSQLRLLGQTPGAILNVRTWENFWGNSNAQYQISAYEYINPATHLNFDGVNDNVAIPPAAINNLTQGTIEVWVYPTASTLDNQTICAKQSNFENTYAYLSIGGGSAANGRVYYQSTNSAFIQSNATIISNQWTHVAVTFTNTQAKIYINGVLDNTVAGNFSLPNDITVTATTIGAILGDGGGQYFTGNLDEFRVWNYALNLADIQNSMNCEAQSQPELMTYYKFNQGFDYTNNSSLTTLVDETGTYNGTLSGFALSGATSNWKSGSAMTSGNTCATLSNTGFESVSNLKIYPNPSTGIFNLEVKDEVTVTIFDLVGKQIKTQQLGVGESAIDISNYTTGVYLLKAIGTNGQITVYKLIKN